MRSRIRKGIYQLACEIMDRESVSISAKDLLSYMDERKAKELVEKAYEIGYDDGHMGNYEPEQRVKEIMDGKKEGKEQQESGRAEIPATDSLE